MLGASLKWPNNFWLEQMDWIFYFFFFLFSPKVVYLCIIFYRMHNFFILKILNIYTMLSCTHLILPSIIEVKTFFFYLSHTRYQSPSFYQNTGPNWLSLFFSECMHDVIQVEQKSCACCKKWYTSILLLTFPFILLILFSSFPLTHVCLFL